MRNHRAPTTTHDQKKSDSVLYSLLVGIVLVICGVVALATYFDVLVK